MKTSDGMLKRLHRYYFIQGEPMIWLTGAGLSLSLLMILGLIVLVLWRGAGAFWQEDLVLLKTKDDKPVLAEILNREPMPAEEGKPSAGFRIRTKIANRDLNGLDFRWIDEPTIVRANVRRTR
jgi:phosphate transport system permease protein